MLSENSKVIRNIQHEANRRFKINQSITKPWSNNKDNISKLTAKTAPARAQSEALHNYNTSHAHRFDPPTRLVLVDNEVQV